MDDLSMDPNGPPHHHIAKVLIDEVHATFADPYETGNPMIIPVCHVRVITVNGELWENNFHAFGLTEAGIIAHWDAHWQEWRRIETQTV